MTFASRSSVISRILPRQHSFILVILQRPILSLCDSETIIHAFVSSVLDYCNVLFSGLPSCVTRSLQLVQNSAARILTKMRKFNHITPILASLYWLPVQARADFKVLLLTYKALHGFAPPYLSRLITPYTPACLLPSHCQC